MSKIRVLYFPDKSVRVIHPIARSRKDGETEEVWLKRVFDKATPSGVEYEDVDSSTLPANRANRAGWEGEKGKGINVNKAKADEFIAKREENKLVHEEIVQMAKERIAARHK